MRSSFSRRDALVGAVSVSALALLGCSDAAGEGATGAAPGDRPSNATAMTVYRDPSCGCCEAWAAIAQRAGYAVTIRDDQDMSTVKRGLGVPETLASCHTAVANGLVIEGHVPMEHVARLLRERPAGVRGIGVPGMPIGSPGMEAPDGQTDPFDVFAFDAVGRTQVFKAG